MSTYIADVLDNDGNSIRPITDWTAIQNAPDFASQIQGVKNSLTGDSGTWTSNGLQFLNGAEQPLRLGTTSNVMDGLPNHGALLT